MYMLSGCVPNNQIKEKKGEIDKQEELVLKSEIEKDNCWICGDSSSLMGYYRKMDTLGLTNLDTLDICSTDVRIFNDDGSEILDSEETEIRSNSYGKNESSVTVAGTPHLGISEVDIYYNENSKLNTDKLIEHFCQVCLDSITDQVGEARNMGNGEILNDIWLVNFKTGELRALPSYCTMFMMDDYYIHVDHEEQKDSMLLFYAPGRSS